VPIDTGARRSLEALRSFARYLGAEISEQHDRDDEQATPPNNETGAWNVGAAKCDRTEESMDPLTA